MHNNNDIKSEGHSPGEPFQPKVASLVDLCAQQKVTSHINLHAQLTGYSETTVNQGSVRFQFKLGTT